MPNCQQATVLHMMAARDLLINVTVFYRKWEIHKPRTIPTVWSDMWPVLTQFKQLAKEADSSLMLVEGYVEETLPSTAVW